ncbi:N-acetyltransferase [Patescibacteria group bacterium]|nr:N-acetyltransferase [Patescibacteria group bacterium]MBU2259543.1 N-acetyltransferase [Patescibacteria group bacterium]
MSETFIHKTAVVDEGAIVGQGTKVWHFCHVMGGASIGADCVLGQNVFVGANVKVGDRVKIQNNVSLYEGVVIEDEAFLGPSCVFTNVRTPRAMIERKDSFERTVVRKGATIGANATIVCGVEIGSYALVGAGAVVSHSVPPHALVLGVPAVQRGWVSHTGARLLEPDKDGVMVCPESGRKYKEVVSDKLKYLDAVIVR